MEFFTVFFGCLSALWVICAMINYEMIEVEIESLAKICPGAKIAIVRTSVSTLLKGPFGLAKSLAHLKR